jgi:Dna[CI] antecedent, DciA
MIPVHRFMPDALAAVLRKAPLTPEKIAFAWRTAVGPSVDRVTTVQLDGHLLRVHTRDAQWRREIEHSASLIRARLDALLGLGVVRGLDVRID